MKNGNVIVSVPGKIHLLGEHAVVYGKPALLAAINKRLTVTISPSNKPIGFHLKEHEKDIILFQKTIEDTIKKTCGIKKIPSYTASIHSDIPLGFGLGSSAALSAAATAALLSFLNISWNKKLVFEIAYQGEKFFHGNPSGGDLATVIEGGLLYFRKEFEFLKSFFSLPFDTTIKNFVIINSGKPAETTYDMVAKVGTLKKSSPKKVAALFNDQELLVKELVLALKEGNENTLISVLRSGEKNLEKLGVVGTKSKKIIRAIEKLGGAAKISGGGGYKKGAGMLLAYHKNPQVILTFAKKNNLDAEKIVIEQTGIVQQL